MPMNSSQSWLKLSLNYNRHHIFDSASWDRERSRKNCCRHNVIVCSNVFCLSIELTSYCLLLENTNDNTMAQLPPPGSFPSYNYMQQPAPQPNGNQQQNLVNGFPPTSNLPPLKPMQTPTQQLPPEQAINYQNFQTNAVHAPAGINGSNSALSSRTSSPGVQQPPIPQSQLPPSRSYPSYQQLHGQQSFQNQQQQQLGMPPSSQLPAPMNNNNNIGVAKGNFNPNSPMNVSMSHLPAQPASALTQQQQMSASMKNLSMNPVAPGNVPAPTLPSSKSDQNFLNNNNNIINNAPGVTSNPSMPQMPPKSNISSMAKRPMYPAQPNGQQPVAQPMGQPQFQQQPQAFNSFPGNGPQTPQMQPQQPLQRGNLQYQNFPQQPQPQQQQPPQSNYSAAGSVVSQGFNRMWGNETIDLMQNRHILPPTKVLPPTVKLNHQFHEATNCSTDIFRCTLTKIPESNSLLQKSRLPLGILIHPYRDLSVSFMIHLKTNDVMNFFLILELASD